MSDPLQRSVESTAVEVEGRTVDVRLFQFDTASVAADPPDFTPYQEEFLRGCFDHQMNAANRITVNVEHEKGIAGVVGHGVSLRSEPDGYHITSVIHKTNGGDATLELLRAGALPHASVEFFDMRNIRRGNVIQRAKARMIAFALARSGSHRGADVLAVRTEDQPEPQTLDAELLPVDIDPERVKRLRALGIVLPDRYQAHPATDTPPAGGTSDDGTRQAEEFAELYVATHGKPTSSEE